MTRPTLVNTYANTGNGSVAVSIPDVQPGDTLVELFGNCYASGTMSPGGAGAGTREPIGAQLGSIAAYQNFNIGAWKRSASGSGTYTFTMSYSDECMGAVLHFRGEVNIDGTPSGIAVRQSPPTVAAAQSIPGVDPDTADALLVGVWGGVQFTGTIAYTKPASMIERAQPRTNEYVALMCATEELSSAAATGARVATSSPVAGNGWSGKLFAVSGVAAAPSGPEPGRGWMGT